MRVLLAAAEGQGAVAAADFSQDTWWIVLVKAVGIIVFLLLSVLFAIWFERKVVGRMQIRPGPNVHGPFGIFQSMADAMKLLFKEDVMVSTAHRLVYVLAPMISVFCSLLVFAVIPFGPAVTMFGVTTPLQLTDFPVAVLYILAAAALGVYGIVLGGWSSGSTYPLLGAVRSTAQVISYELGMGLSLVSVFILAGSMSTSQIVASQAEIWWFLPLLPAFCLYIITMVGETNRLPFDLPEAEGELVSGYMTEYSGFRFLIFFIAEFATAGVFSMIAAILFLGGWGIPFAWFGWESLDDVSNWMNIVGPLILFTKMMLLSGLIMWVRFSYPRFREDQLQRFAWKVLIPLSILNIAVTAVVKVAV